MTNRPPNEALTPWKDVCWKVRDGLWMLVTHRGPREMEKTPTAVYYPPDAPRRFQYRLTRRPRGAAVLQ